VTDIILTSVEPNEFTLGPFSVIVLGLLGTVIAALMLIVLLGTVVVWIPVAILFVAAAMLSNLLRRRDSPDVPELIQ
jgi:membrane protein implicated in regulation of membrane protease activity